MVTAREWYAIVAFGSGPAPARGPFTSVEEAEQAVERFRERRGWTAGEHLAAGSVRIVGPFATRERARNADISQGPVVTSVR